MISNHPLFASKPQRERVMWIASCVGGTLTLAQIVLVFTIHRPTPALQSHLATVLWVLSAMFGWLPIFTLRRKGGVPQGKAYVNTTQLVESGIYAIVRHPQMGSAWLLMCLSLMLQTNHWSSVALGLPAMGLIYLVLFLADQNNIEKFGPAYERYMARVPRVNFLWGLIKLAI